MNLKLIGLVLLFGACVVQKQHCLKECFATMRSNTGIPHEVNEARPFGIVQNLIQDLRALLTNRISIVTRSINTLSNNFLQEINNLTPLWINELNAILNETTSIINNQFETGAVTLDCIGQSASAINTLLLSTTTALKGCAQTQLSQTGQIVSNITNNLNVTRHVVQNVINILLECPIIDIVCNEHVLQQGMHFLLTLPLNISTQIQDALAIFANSRQNVQNCAMTILENIPTIAATIITDVAICTTTSTL